MRRRLPTGDWVVAETYSPKVTAVWDEAARGLAIEATSAPTHGSTWADPTLLDLRIGRPGPQNTAERALGSARYERVIAELLSLKAAERAAGRRPLAVLFFLADSW